jgi:hypothetical protein
VLLIAFGAARRKTGRFGFSNNSFLARAAFVKSCGGDGCGVRGFGFERRFLFGQPEPELTRAKQKQQLRVNGRPKKNSGSTRVSIGKRNDAAYVLAKLKARRPHCRTSRPSSATKPRSPRQPERSENQGEKQP